MIRVLVLGLGILCALAVAQKDRILLRDVPTLTFERGKMTTGRRGDPVPQMECIAVNCRTGTGCKEFVQPSAIQCVNVGGDLMNVQWQCQAALVDGIDLGKVEVVCEGYDNADDPYVLEGSCGIEYELDQRGDGEWEVVLPEGTRIAQMRRAEPLPPPQKSYIEAGDLNVIPDGGEFADVGAHLKSDLESSARWEEEQRRKKEEIQKEVMAGLDQKVREGKLPMFMHSEFGEMVYEKEPQEQEEIARSSWLWRAWTGFWTFVRYALAFAALLALVVFGISLCPLNPKRSSPPPDNSADDPKTDPKVKTEPRTTSRKTAKVRSAPADHDSGWNISSLMSHGAAAVAGYQYGRSQGRQECAPTPRAPSPPRKASPPRSVSFGNASHLGWGSGLGSSSSAHRSSSSTHRSTSTGGSSSRSSSGNSGSAPKHVSRSTGGTRRR